jgi:hypothetical protein
MGLLAPLYALAALAIVGPILFHLIKRQPQGQQRFSSLMFLSPSPPRLTRRSRLDNILLLVLRALAIGLIAFAFARPFFRQESFLHGALDGRNIALLIDTSASMRREDVWEAAKQQSLALVDGLSPEDRVALYTISDRLTPVIALDTEGGTDPASQQQAVRTAINDLSPSWRGSKIADGLKSVADLIQAAAIAGKLGGDADAELVLVTDLHTNCGIESLQGYPWPESIRLDVRQVRPSRPGNARASLILDGELGSGEADESLLKVRVENNSDSVAQSFELQWLVNDQPIAGAATSLQVPAGQVRVIPAPAQPSGATRLELRGDSWAGDNTLFVAQPVRSRERIVFVGSSQQRKEDDLAYFIEKAPLSTELVNRSVERMSIMDFSAQLPDLMDRDSAEVLRAVIVEPPFSNEDAQKLKLFAERGGSVIVCLARPQSDMSEVQSSLRELFSSPRLEVTEGEVKEFALLSNIDFRHPVFSPFADPRYNDFSKIRFWSHRRVGIPADEQTNLGDKNLGDKTAANARTIRTIASLDDGSPWLLQQSAGEGNLWLLTSGWQPASSQLGLSSKFVPILLGMLDPTGRTLSAQLVFSVGEPITGGVPGQWVISNSEGARVEPTIVDGTVQLEEPGLYYLQEEQVRRQVAIQVPTSESQLTPLDVDAFEQYGIELGKVQSDAERKQAARQLQVTELERKQRVWQWLLLAGLIVLAVETALAGWFARRTSASFPNAQPQAVG